MRDKAVLKVFTIDTIMHQMFAKKEKSSRSFNKSALILQANPLIGIPSFQTSQSRKCISAFEQQSLAGQNQS